METETVTGEIVEDDNAPASLATIGEIDQTLMGALKNAGYIVPVALPQELRKASELKQRIYAAILDERDYMYTVNWTENGHSKQFITMSKSQADETAGKFGGSVAAKPKKSGCFKLARALGIVCKPIVREEKTIRGVQGFYVVYEARHEATGLCEEGIGFCDPTERSRGMSVHDMISTADTRAYNRAILRLSGFGDVSADEVIAGASSLDEDSLPDFVPEPPVAKPVAALLPPNDDNVITAARIWAEAISSRDGTMFAPAAKQDTMSSREMRARARRGDERAAQKLGALGLQWEGVAQDGTGQPTFEVEPPPLKPEDIKLSAALQNAAEASANPKPNGTASAGLDLTGDGADKNDDNPPWEEESSFGIPAPDLNTEKITIAQAKKLSQQLFALHDNNRDKARAWVKAEMRVEGAVNIRANQYSAAMSALQKLTAEKENA